MLLALHSSAQSRLAEGPQLEERSAGVEQQVDEFADGYLAALEQDRAQLISALDVAERHDLTTYDAAYLALATRLDPRLLMLDRQLALAAGRRAISIGDVRFSDLRQPYEREVTWPNYRGASAYLAKLRAEAAHGEEANDLRTRCRPRVDVARSVDGRRAAGVASEP